MLQFLEFYEKFFNIFCRKIDDGQIIEYFQSFVLDIFCWLVGVYLNGFGSLKEGNESLFLKI